MVIVMVGVMVKISVTVGVRVSVRSIVRVSYSAGLRSVEAPGQQCYRKVVDVMSIST